MASGPIREKKIKKSKRARRRDDLFIG